MASSGIDLIYHGGHDCVKTMQEVKEMGEGDRVVISVEEAGRRLSISRQLAYQLARSGVIPAIRLGKRRLVVPLAAFEKMLGGGWKPP